MINWRVRFKNKVFNFQFMASIIVPILAYYGVAPQDLTTWGSLFDVSRAALSNPFIVATIALSLFNAVTDPTTKSIADSPDKMNYKEPK